jgi:hypothetical protein
VCIKCIIKKSKKNPFSKTKSKMLRLNGSAWQLENYNYSKPILKKSHLIWTKLTKRYTCFPRALECTLNILHTLHSVHISLATSRSLHVARGYCQFIITTAGLCATCLQVLTRVTYKGSPWSITGSIVAKLGRVPLDLATDMTWHSPRIHHVTMFSFQPGHRNLKKLLLDEWRRKLISIIGAKVQSFQSHKRCTATLT